MDLGNSIVCETTFYWGSNVLKKLFSKLKKKKTDQANSPEPTSTKLTGNIQRDEQMLRNLFRDCDDVKYKKIYIPSMDKRKGLIIYVEGLINIDTLQRDIIGPLLSTESMQAKEVTEIISAGETKFYYSTENLASEVLLGKVAVLVEGMKGLVTIETKEWPMRSIEEPIQERLIRGSREGFTEVIQVNLGLIRRRLPDDNMKVRHMSVGRRTRTKVAVMYIEDICNLDTVKEIRERLKAIEIDGILDPGSLSELITERTITPFPLLLSTERPDKVAGSLLQGKIAIVSDGSPFVVLAPVTAADFFQIPEDYYMHPLFAFLGRALRLGGIFLGTTLVAAFTAVISFHYEMIPENIVVFIAETRAGVPFAPLTEALLLELSVELMREASIRLPGPIGPTLGIVGALILGQAAVEARLVSPVMLIVVAVSFMAGSIIPNYEAALVVRWMRFPVILASGFL